MAQEIERKFLLASEDWRSQVHESRDMHQAYLGGDGVSVRVRIAGSRAWLNIKEMKLGRSRQEFEVPMPVEEAHDLIQLAPGGRIEKTRHFVRHGSHLWEIDEFKGDNAGLLVAEVELQTEREPFDKPGWLGREVTDQERYYNVCLSRHPFREWDTS